MPNSEKSTKVAKTKPLSALYLQPNRRHTRQVITVIKARLMRRQLMTTTGCHWTKRNQRVGGCRKGASRWLLDEMLKPEGQMFTKAQTGGGHHPVKDNSKYCWASVQRPHTGLPVSSSRYPGLHPKRTRDPFSLARYYSINFRNLHQLHYSQSATSKLNQPYSTLLQLHLPHSCILKIPYVICK